MTTNRRHSASANGAAPAIEAQPLAFEEALGKLDAAVSALEGGQLSLEASLALYEEGVRLATRCQELLDSADLRVQRLSADGGGLLLTPFEPDGE
ncbi:MAG: exodeoxyribonuclease VII small subunit [Ktedonobacterales bacterium]|jgi:exodeoxyribonuclease VII small subunit